MAHAPIPLTARLRLATVAYRTGTLVLAVFALAGQVVYLDVLYWNALGLGRYAHDGMVPALVSAVVSGATVSLVVGIQAVALAFRGTGARGARPLGIALAAWSYLLAYSGLTVLMAPDPASPLRFPFQAHFLLVEALGLAALIRFSVVFPRAMEPGFLRAPDELAVGLRTLQHLRLWLLRPAAPWIAGFLSLGLALGFNAALGRPNQEAALLPLTDALRLAALTVVVLNLRAGYVAADREARRSIFWLVVGFTLLVGAVGALLGGNVLTTVTDWEIPGFNWRPVVLDLGVLGLVWGAGMAVFYDGRLRPGALVRRLTVVFIVVTAALFLAAGMETLFSGRTAVPGGVGTLLTLVGMAVLYTRIRDPLERMLYHAWVAPADGDPA